MKTTKLKTLKELTLLDKFLFDETMDHPEIHEAALQIILGKDNLRLLTPAQTEKELRTMPWLKNIRMDVFSMDHESTVYNTEMQADQKPDLIRRSRYYQGLIDSSLLAPGNSNYNLLNDSCVIMITPFDLFGKGRYCYTFVPCCKEDKSLETNDGTTRIFLNTKGTNDHEVSQELIDFLHYIETLDGNLVENSGSERLKKIHACVNQIKASEEMGVKYMQKWEEKLLDREEGKEEGRKEGRKEGREEGLQAATLICLQNLMTNLNIPMEEALSILGVPKENWKKYLQQNQ